MRFYRKRLFFVIIALAVFVFFPISYTGVHAATPVEDFVTRTYKIALNRDPDPAGFNNWVSWLKAGSISGATLAKEFLAGPEFVNRGVGNSDFVSIVYQVMLNRLPDAGGLQYWTSMLDDGVTRLYMLSQFVQNTEYKNFYATIGVLPGNIVLSENIDARPELTTFVNRFYVYVLGRGADGDGLRNFVNLLAAQNMTGAQLAENFIFSAEFKSKSVSNEEYVSILYRVFLNREVDPLGASTWVYALYNGATRRNVLYNLVGSQEFANLCAQKGIAQGTIVLGVVDNRGDLVRFVSGVYNNVLGRNPDEDGLINHVEALASNSLSGADMLAGFVLGKEFMDKNIGANKFVEILYKSCFNRGADPAGMNNWLTQIMSGYSRRYILAGFVNSQEFKNLAATFNVTSGILSTGNSDIPTNGIVKAYTNTEVNLRTQPNTTSTSAVITKVPQGSKVVIIGREINFYLARYLTSDNRLFEGYLWDDYVQPYTDDINNTMLGVLSGKYESNGNPGTVSSGAGDYGGKSYGAWQLASNPAVGSLQTFLDWLPTVRPAYSSQLMAAKQLDGDTFGENFDNAWRAIAANNYFDFLNIQHSYTKTVYYDRLIAKLMAAGAYDELLGSFAVRNVLWSTAIQHGISGSYNIVTKVGNIRDKQQFISAIYDERSNVEVYFKSSPTLWDSLRSRFAREKQDALKMYNYEVNVQ